MPRLALPLALVAVILFGVAYVTRITGELSSARAEAVTAKADAAGKAAAIVALEAEALATAARARTSAAAHARIRRAPASSDGSVAPVLRDALEGLR